MASEQRQHKLEKRRRLRHNKRDKSMEEIQKAVWERNRRLQKSAQDATE